MVWRHEEKQGGRKKNKKHGEVPCYQTEVHGGRKRKKKKPPPTNPKCGKKKKVNPVQAISGCGKQHAKEKKRKEAQNAVWRSRDCDISEEGKKEREKKAISLCRRCPDPAKTSA